MYQGNLFFTCSPLRSASMRGQNISVQALTCIKMTNCWKIAKQIADLNLESDNAMAVTFNVGGCQCCSLQHLLHIGCMQRQPNAQDVASGLSKPHQIE